MISTTTPSLELPDRSAATPLGEALDESPRLLPARMLNEFAYCQRLAYLEWVQGEFAHNLETLQGRFGHRRVDQPTRGEVPQPANTTDDVPSTRGGEPTDIADLISASEPSTAVRQEDPAQSNSIHARSLLLSAPREGLICKLDILELDGAVATPVDYKRGSPPDNEHQAWEPERVQVCAQGLILREAGYQSDSGILYFIESKQRIEVAFDDELVNRTRQLIAEMRLMGSNRRLPPPLDDSPKCPRCSLVAICLPDETNLLLAEAKQIDADQKLDQVPDDPTAESNRDHFADAPADGEYEFESHRVVEGRAFGAPMPAAQSRPREATRQVRKLLPVRDEALPLHVVIQGASLGKSGDRLTIKEKGKTIQSVRMIDVSQVSLYGNVLVTAQAVRELADRGVPVCHFSYGGWLSAITTGLAHKNVELRIKQFAAAADECAALAVARWIIVGKIKNCRTLLRRHLPEGNELLLSQLADSADEAACALSAESLLGIEGMAAKLYFSGFAKLLRGGETFRFENRNRRPPTDPANALLSFVYSMLTRELTVAVQAVGFDPMLGMFHRPRYGRPSLALDLAEEFRPLIADSTVLMLVNNGEVSAESFVSRGGAVALTDAGRKAVIAAFERRMETEVTHPLFGYKASYRRILEVQARLLSRVLLGELAEYPPMCTR